MVLARVRSIRSQPTRNRRRMVVVEVTDGTGSLRVTFFNQPFRERQLRPGTEAVLFGKLEVFRGQRQMTNPVVDLIGDKTGRIVPVYPQSEKAGVMTWDIAKIMDEVLERAGDFADPVPDEVRERYGLVDRTRAFHDIHHPESMAAAQAARKRLVFDELLRVQLELVRRKRELEATARGFRHETGDGDGLVSRFHESLPFPLRAPSSGPSARSRPTWPGPTRCTACCRATSARARRWWPSAPCWWPWPAGTRARSWPPPRCWPSSTRSASAACSTGSPCPWPRARAATCSRRRRASGPCGSSC